MVNESVRQPALRLRGASVDVGADSRIHAHRAGVLTAVDRMRANIAGRLELRQLAAAASMSPFHFIRVFRSMTGITPARFLAALRIEAAKRLLLETSLTVTDVCFEVGYSSVGTFTRLFSEFVGLSPTAFRAIERASRPFELDELVERYLSRPSITVGARVNGSLIQPPDFVGTTFIGLFPSSIPQRRPLAGTLAFGSGRFELECGQRTLPASVLAVALPSPLDMRTCLLPSQQRVLVAASCLPNADSPLSLTLRFLQPFDAPVLTALPVLLIP